MFDEPQRGAEGARGRSSLVRGALRVRLSRLSRVQDGEGPRRGRDRQAGVQRERQGDEGFDGRAPGLLHARRRQPTHGKADALRGALGSGSGRGGRRVGSRRVLARKVFRRRSPPRREASEWWRATAAAFDDPASLRETFERQYELGYYNHYFLPEKAGDPNAPVLCLWESAKSVTVEEFRSFIDGADGPFPNGEFANDVYAIAPTGATGAVPATGFIAPADRGTRGRHARGSRFWVRHR